MRIERGCALAHISFIVLILGGCGKSSAPPAGRPISIRSSIPQALILVDGKSCGSGTCEVSLTGSNHELSTRLDGYKPAVARIDVANTGSIAPVLLTPEPQLTTVRVSSDLGHAVVALDKGAPQPIESVSAQFTDVPAGAHVLHFQAEVQRTDIGFSVTPAAIPSITPLPHRSLAATAAAVLGKSVVLESTLIGAEIRIDGQLAGKMQPSGFRTGVGEGNHEILVTAPDGLASKLAFEAGPVPTLAVSINGRGWATRSQPLPALPLAQQPAPVKPATVRMPEIPKVPMTASLSVHGAPAGAQVLIDDRLTGEGRQDGTFSVRDVPLGRHTVTIRKQGFNQRTFDLVFAAGGAQDVDGALSATPTTPAAAPAAARTEPPVTAPAPARKQAVVVTVALPDATRSLYWTRESGYAVRKGGGLLLIPKVTGPGSIIFTASVQKGKRLEWVMAYENEKNQILYQIDGDSLNRTVYRNGGKTSSSVPLKLKRDDWFKVGIAVADEAIAVYAAPAGSKLQPIDRVTGDHLARGGFGFVVPGHDQIALSDFQFAPK